MTTDEIAQTQILRHSGISVGWLDGAARQEEATKFTEARKANETVYRYLLFTVLFSVALFLGGIIAAFKRRKIRSMVLALSAITLTMVAFFMAFLPPAEE
jgi:hypothetical protein